MSVKVLAVDDSFMMRELIKFTLANAGFYVCLAKDGLDALKQLEEVEPDLILTDLNMPNMDGFDLILAVRQGNIFSKVPILILTTEKAEKLKDQARSIGATGWITKPFDDKSLVETIRRVTVL